MFDFDRYHIDAEIIEDSVNTVNNKRISTLKIRVPRMILAEFNTHRILSKNFSSSRAIPAKKIREEVLHNPMMPVYWGANKSGMSASEELTGWRKAAAKLVWKLTGKINAGSHWLLEKIGLHKQTCNRIVEPWLSVTGTVTGTDWDNFFRLRLDENAQPEMQCLAYSIKQALDNSNPKLLQTNEVHLPYVDQEERQKYDMETLVKISAARCCRTSYNNMLGKKSQPDEDVKLYDRVSTNGHFSPLEHIAFVPHNGLLRKVVHKDLQRNLNGWYQFRAFVDTPKNTTLLSTNYNLDLADKQ